MDIDGKEYIDIAMGFGLNLFGQSPDFVTQALKEQLDRGVEVGPQSPLAGEVANCSADLVAWIAQHSATPVLKLLWPLCVSRVR